MAEDNPRIWYGDPAEPIEELMKFNSEHDEPPHDGDELCDGHQAHYTWRNGAWGG